MFGYIKVAACVPLSKVGDCEYNLKQIFECLEMAKREKVKLLLFPELAVCSYTCGDLFFQSLLIEKCEESIKALREKSKDYDMVIIVGTPVLENGRLFNCACVIHNGEILGLIPKEILPEHGEFTEKRWFRSGSSHKGNTMDFAGGTIPFGNILFKCQNHDYLTFSAEVCADVWSINPPSTFLSELGAVLNFNCSASPVYAGKPLKRRKLMEAHSARCKCAYVYTSSSIGESSTDAVFDGDAIIAVQGEIVKEARSYMDTNELICCDVDLQEISICRQKTSTFESRQALDDVITVAFSFKNAGDDSPVVKPSRSPFVPEKNTDEFYEDVTNIQTAGLMKRLKYTGIKRSVIGVSGGLDSTLALLVTANCCDKMKISRQEILGITMPGFGTSGRTHQNALSLMKELGISMKEISIKEACLQHFKDIGHDKSVHNTTYENVQARERTQILMDIANMEGGLVVGTGDMSELALGWATFNGDHMSMYGVNSGVPKTIVKQVVAHFCDRNTFGSQVGDILKDILFTPVSPELLPTDNQGEIAQKTEDLVGPYELHDFFLYYMVGKSFSPKKIFFLTKAAFAGVYSDEIILKWMKVFYKRFFSQQFKRSCMPDGPKVLEFGLSSRGDLRMVSDVESALWLKELETVE